MSPNCEKNLLQLLQRNIRGLISFTWGFFPNVLSQIKYEAVNNLCLTSRELFRYIGETTVSITTQCCVLKKVRTSVKPVTMIPLTKTHLQKGLKWTEDNMKVDFSKVLFLNESHATFDGPDGWSKSWVVNQRDHHQCLGC